MSSITHVASASHASPTSQTSFNINWPTVQANDVALLLWVFASSQTGTPPAGLTQVSSLANSNGSNRSILYSKVMVGDEDGTSMTWSTTGAGNRQCLGISIYRGVNHLDPINGFSSFIENVSRSSHPFPAYTPDETDCGIVAMITERQSSGTNAWTHSSGYNERVDISSVATGGTALGIADDLITARPSGVAVTPGNYVSGNSINSTTDILFTVALNQLAAPSDNSDMFPFFF